MHLIPNINRSFSQTDTLMWLWEILWSNLCRCSVLGVPFWQISHYSRQWLFSTCLVSIRDIMQGGGNVKESIFGCWCCRGYMWFTASWTNRCTDVIALNLSLLFISIDQSDHPGDWFQVVFMFEAIAVYFKTLCNWIFHKPTLSIPVSLPHFLHLSLFHSLLSLKRFPQAANHRIHCNTCNYFLTINCYLATGSLERVRERERERRKRFV